MNYREVLLRLIAYTTPYVYDNNISLLELTRKLYKIVNELCQAMKEMSDEMDGIKETITDTTRTVLLEMKDDGTLAEIINETLFNELNERLNLLSQSVLSLSERVTTNETNIENLSERISSDEQEIQRVDQKIDSEIGKLNISYSDDNNVVMNKDVFANNLSCKNILNINDIIRGGYSDTTYVPNTTNYVTIQYIPVERNKTYTLSSLNVDLSKYTGIRVVSFGENKQFLRRGILIPLSNETRFTVDNETYYIAICFYTEQTANVNDFTRGQLEIGENATKYIEHKNYDNTEHLLLYNPAPTWDETSYELKDDPKKYSKLKIYFSRYGVATSSVEIDTSNMQINCILSYCENSILRLYCTVFEIINRTISVKNSGYVNIFENATVQPSVNQANQLSITKIVGIK